MVFTARFIDRIGKGIRGAPRDALVADVAPSEMRGAAFGLRQSLDTVGAFIGPLLALGLMLLWANDFRAVFWVAVIPGAARGRIAGLRRARTGTRSRGAPDQSDSARESAQTVARVLVGRQRSAPYSHWRASAKRFWYCAQQQGGLPLALVPLVLIGMNVVYALSAYPFGRLSDRISHARLLALGPRGADRRRCRARLQQPVDVGMARRLAVGSAHGHHAGTAGDDGRRRRTRRLARHRIRIF